MKLSQGDIIKTNGIQQSLFVASKDFFNESGEAIVCPIFEESKEGPLHIKISTEKTTGFVHCEKLKLLDLDARGFVHVDNADMSDIIEITDAIQSIFDYV